MRIVVLHWQLRGGDLGKSGKKSRKKGRPHPSALQGIYFGEGMVVAFSYAMWTAEGVPVDSGNIGEPLRILHGDGQVPAAVEAALVGKERADRVDLVVDYWEQPGAGQIVLPRGDFPTSLGLGMPYSVNGSVAYVQAIEAEQVTLSLDSPLAGQKVKVSLRVVDVRLASPEELALGRVLEEDPG